MTQQQLEHVRDTMAFGMTAVGVYVVVHNDSAPGTDEWSDYVRDMESQASSIRGLAIYSSGGGPNAVQRKLVADVWERAGFNPTTVLVTTSKMVRSIATGLNWFLAQKIRAFPPEDLDAALRVLPVDEAASRVVLERIEALRSAIEVKSRRTA